MEILFTMIAIMTVPSVILSWSLIQKYIMNTALEQKNQELEAKILELEEKTK